MLGSQEAGMTRHRKNVNQTITPWGPEAAWRPQIKVKNFTWGGGKTILVHEIRMVNLARESWEDRDKKNIFGGLSPKQERGRTDK